MNVFSALLRRNCKLFFRDKGVFFPSLLAPLILLFLFIAFLGDVYRDSIRGVAASFGFTLANGAVESIAGGWLFSTLLSVCAVTVAFTANTVMVQDRVNGQAADFSVTPAPRAAVALAYFFATFLVTLTVCAVALTAGFVYLAAVGWELSAGDVLLSIVDTALLSLFGTALSSVVCHFLHSQGGVTAVQATVSAAYGFLCGAYMPMSSLAPWLARALSLLPGTYGTALLHERLMGGAIDAMQTSGAPQALADAMRTGFDCTVEFFGTAVPVWAEYLALALAVLALVALYVVLCAVRIHKKRI